MIALAPFGRSHLASTYHWIQQPDVRRGILFDRPVDPKSHEAWFDAAMADAGQRHYAIMSGTNHVGNFGYRNINRHDARADLFIYLDAAARGRGWGFAAVGAGLDKGFGELSLRKIALTVRTDNTPAIRLYRRAGFADEGVLKAEVVYEGQPVDVLRMGKVRV